MAIYKCEACSFETHHKNNYKKHTETNKHKNIIKNIKTDHKNSLVQENLSTKKVKNNAKYTNVINVIRYFLVDQIYIVIKNIIVKENNQMKKPRMIHNHMYVNIAVKNLLENKQLPNIN